MNTARDMFLFVDDVMNITGTARSKAYDIIRQFNRELEEKGFCTVQGRVNRKYFYQRFGLDDRSAPEKHKTKAAG